MNNSNKLPGKTPWSGRRRPMTRKSGYSVTSDVRIATEEIPTYLVRKGRSFSIDFVIHKVPTGTRVGFGGWFMSSHPMAVEVDNVPASLVCVVPTDGEWGKIGSQWVTESAGQMRIAVSFSAAVDTEVALYDLEAGRIEHDGIENARPELLTNMWTFAPEANFISESTGSVEIANLGSATKKSVSLALKSCNRCGRFLPINLQPFERRTLSFSNHCIARAPCRHSSFGRIQKIDEPGVQIELDHGFQLECRYCKKFYVNAPLNPQRSAGQMKEDGARRRGFELLLEHLNEGSPQLQYKNRTGRDLASDIYLKFGGKCFKCGKDFESKKAMHLDHTRPLALLWPLDEHGTALCSVHNAEKRDRAPVEYYTSTEIRRLSRVTGLSLEALSNPSPNVEAISKLISRLDWFFDEFLTSSQLGKVREGKATAELMVKALQKAIDRVPGGPPIDLLREFERRRRTS